MDEEEAAHQYSQSWSHGTKKKIDAAQLDSMLNKKKRKQELKKQTKRQKKGLKRKRKKEREKLREGRHSASRRR